MVRLGKRNKTKPEEKLRMGTKVKERINEGTKCFRILEKLKQAKPLGLSFFYLVFYNALQLN